MRIGAPLHKPKTDANQEQLQTPGKRIPDDFEPEDIESAAKAIRPLWEKDREQCDNERRSSLQRIYELGQKVAEQYETVKAKRKFHGETMYGERFFQRVADAINAKSAKKVSWQLLYDCRTLACTYDEQAYAELCRHDQIMPSHVLQLARIQIDDVRAELQAGLIKEKWTVRELATAVKEKLGPRRKPGAGRRPKVSKHAKGAIIHLTAQAKQFVKANDEIWFGDAFDIPTAVREIPSSKLTDELKTQIGEAAELCDKVAETAGEKGGVLREVLANVEHRMRAQAEHERRMIAEEDEDKVVCATAG